MTFPKSGSRRIVVGGESYIWHLRGKTAYFVHAAIRHAAAPQGQLLVLDFHQIGCEIRPQIVRGTINFAFAQGWKPREKAAPLFLVYDDGRFVVSSRGF